MNYKAKKALRLFIPKFVLMPVVNIIRLLKALLTDGTNNFSHLDELHELWLKVKKYEKNQENLLRQMYQDVASGMSQKETFRSREMSIYSQNGEDGILLYIFSMIGSVNRQFVEFGAGGKTSNTENLIRNFGWRGLLIDGDNSEIERIQRYYNKLPMVGNGKVRAVQAWITVDNINQLFRDNGVKGEIDLLSIDIDGNDYWIWKAIDVIQPRVVVIEYNASLGPDRALTIEYNPTHSKLDYHPLGWYHGASLSALSKLAKKKNYILVACESSGVNAFFVRSDLAQGIFSEQSASEAYYSDIRRDELASQMEQYNQIKHYNFVEV